MLVSTSPRTGWTWLCAPAVKHFAVPRDTQGLRELNARLTPFAPTAIGIEATGGYETVVAASLAAAGLPVVVVNPARVRAFAQALGKRAKTDPLDAASSPTSSKPPTAAAAVAGRGHTASGRSGRTARPDRRDDGRRTSPPEAVDRKACTKSIVRLLAALQKELSAVDAAIDDAVRGSPAWREKEDLLVSASGVGKTVART